MKRTGLIIIIALGLAIALYVYWVAGTNTRSHSTRLQTQSPGISSVATATPPGRASINSLTASMKEKEAAKTVTKVFSAPISFFGKVQDQTGVPIGGARVEFGAIDKFWEPGSDYQTLSDANGLFAITGIKGAGLTVGVSKEGYGSIEGFSYQSFGYGMPPDSTRKAPPRQDVPAIFVLRKKTPAEPLRSVRRDILVPKDGTPVEVSLTTGKAVNWSNGDIIIECWTDDFTKDTHGHYNWKSRLSVPGGGLMIRADPEMSFEAPENGYVPAIEVSVSQDSPQWRADSDEEYWVKLGRKTFARMRFRITTAGAHFASISAYLNPSGSRNLEYDENKIIK